MGCSGSAPAGDATSEAVDALFDAGGRRAVGRHTAVRIRRRDGLLFEGAVRVLTQSFAGTDQAPGDPCYAWVYNGLAAKGPLASPPSAARLKWFEWLCRQGLLMGVAHGGAYALVNDAGGDVTAACVTAPPGTTFDVGTCAMFALLCRIGPPPSPEAGGGSRFASVRRGMAFEAALAKTRTESGELHLGMLGVDPRLQGTGLGSALLELVADMADADGVGAYVECCGAKNEGFYARGGGFGRGGGERTRLQIGGAEPIDIATMVRPARAAIV